jgi:hypothetical protein
LYVNIDRWIENVVFAARGAVRDRGCAYHLQHYAGHVPTAVHVRCHWCSALQGKRALPFHFSLRLDPQWWGVVVVVVVCLWGWVGAQNELCSDFTITTANVIFSGTNPKVACSNANLVTHRQK